MGKREGKRNPGITIGLLIFGLAALVFLLKMLLRGKDIALLSPQGYIATQEKHLILLSAAILLGVAVPTILLLYFIAWKYRENNTKATFDPQRRNGKFLVFSIWAFPGIVALGLSFIMWPAAHNLDQHRSIASETKPLTIQVVAMRWKWLFIYPEQNISTVNYIQVPVGTPLQFELTADEAPMSSFWIPHLGGQLYAMTGHMNRLNLIANTPGDYPGRSAEINGTGFEGMKFITRATNEADFDQWVTSVRLSSNALDDSSYEKLLTPSENNTAQFYSLADAGLYDKVINKYMGSHHHTLEQK